MCELCKKHPGVDVHHLQHQNKANNDGIIANSDLVFHKNKLANLMVLCEACHDKMHKTDKQYKRVKTTNGYELQEI
jgi:DNA mismatch repair protein MutS